jgi:hypothetical protein
MTPEQREALIELYRASFDWRGEAIEENLAQAEELRRGLGAPLPHEVADISCLFHEAWHPKGFPSLLCASPEEFRVRMGGMLGSEHLAEDLFARLARLIVHPDFRTDISQQIYRGLGVAGVEIARKMLRKFLKEVEG